MKIPRIIPAIALSFLASTAALWSANATPTPASPSVTEQAKIKQTKNDLMSLSTALQMYKLNAGNYPTVEQGLESLVEKPVADPIPRRWVMLVDKIPQDPWGHDYRYVTRKEKDKIVHVIISGGSDPLDASDNVEQVLEAIGK